MGRKCCVPNCYTGYASCKEKASMFRVPDNDFFLNKWQAAIAREDRLITPKDYVCEKHFKPEDVIRRRFVHNSMEEYKVPKLRQDAVPCIFPDLPEFIKKMVKKRRKMPMDDLIVPVNSEENNILIPGTHFLFDKIKSEQDTNAAENVEVIKIKNEPAEHTTSIIDNCEIDIKTEVVEEEACTNFETDPVEDDLSLGPRIYRCDKCDYSSKYQGNIKTHQTKHLTGDEAYYRCQHCPNFKSKWSITYKNHLRIRHCIGKQEIYKCTLCNFETKVKICLKRHLMRHNLVMQDDNLVIETSNSDTEIETFKCRQCSFESNLKIYLLKHMKQTHGKKLHSKHHETRQKLFKCSKCYYHCSSKNSFQKHVGKHKTLGNDQISSIVV